MTAVNDAALTIARTRYSVGDMGARWVIGLVLAGITVSAAGCTRGETEGFDKEQSDYTPTTIRQFDRFPLYWTGTSFGPYKLHTITESFGFVTFTYGTCTPTGGDEPSCSPPVEIQVEPICLHLSYVLRNGRWRTRSARGVPVAALSGPILLTRRAAIKVDARTYDMAVKVFDALRSTNDVAPVIAVGEPFPPLSEQVLNGDRPCVG
jgi:hypothetical protein